MEILPILGVAGIIEDDADSINQNRRIVPLPNRELSEIQFDSPDYLSDAERILEKNLGVSYELCSVIPTRIIRRGNLPTYIPVQGNNPPIAYIPIGPTKNFSQVFLVRKV